MKRSFWLTLTLALLAFLLLPMTGLSEPLSSKIQNQRNKIAGKLHHEGVLTTTISTFNNRIRGLQGNIRGLQQREEAIQSDLDQKRAELAAIQNKLQVARDRLARLKARLALSMKQLAARLVDEYEADEPDMVTVILESHGFDDLLTRADFMQRISHQDQQVVGTVKVLKAQTAQQAKDLAVLEGKAQDAANAILAQRNAVAASKAKLVTSRDSLQRARDGRQVVLSRVRSSRVHAQEDLKTMLAQQQSIQNQIQSNSGGPFKHGSGQLIWPVNGPITSPFCERRPWEACHPGIDIGVPEGTPIHAADSGRVSIAGWVSGYGNYTCIQHTATLSTCYGHQSRIEVSVGQSVSQGQVIGLTGCTGLCFGPHLHFEVRINGSVVNPMNYL
ncbi:MAG TPA: peptidoglycan DD-metalloendopeptidase family protein [Thermoleophilaceae bacterium]|jgi:murein DD-endopeptidase MepM/ murein hydrolase activator NlpD